MARVRRKTAATGSRLNFEIAGIAAIGLALLLGLALVVPSPHSGLIGTATAWALIKLFGSAAGWFPFLIALVGAIVFLEINVPRMIATLGTAAAAFFLIADIALGAHGGILGRLLDGALVALVGETGERIVLVVAALSLAVWITNVSVKKVIGWCIARIAALRPPREKTAAPKDDVTAPRTLREAFHLPALLSRPAAAPAALTVVEPPIRLYDDTVAVPDTHESEDDEDALLNEEDVDVDDAETDDDDEYEDDDEFEDDEDEVEELDEDEPEI